MPLKTMTGLHITPSPQSAAVNTSNQDNKTDYDIFIIGGGINGCGIARDAAGRGYNVALAEMNDLASGTSSWSTKIIHGGLRYLEHYEFRLVREALKEREVLMRLAPHIIRPMRFVLPHQKGLRPKWLLRLGLFIYDHLGGRMSLPRTATLNLRTHICGAALRDTYKHAFAFSDCRVDDARLVVLNAQDAKSRGAHIMPRTKVISALRSGGGKNKETTHWVIETQNTLTGARQNFTAKMVVNAGGPWADIIAGETLSHDNATNKDAKNKQPRLRLVQGSHIVIRKKFDHDYAYFFQNPDGRIFFAIPYHDDFTLIGTTDHDFTGDPSAAEITQGEMDYMCRAASAYFNDPITSDDIVWHFAGVRALYNDGANKAQNATRDYVLTLNADKDAPPLLSVYGGKLTTYRRLAESALDKIDHALSGKRREKTQRWTAAAPLGGGDFPAHTINNAKKRRKKTSAVPAPVYNDDAKTIIQNVTQDSVTDLINAVHERYRFLPRRDAVRLVDTYGTKSYDILGDATTTADMGAQFLRGLSAREVTYLITHEFAKTANDVLWRRTKLGLYAAQDDIRALEDFMAKF